MNKKMNVKSFNLDHIKVKAPYLHLADKNNRNLCTNACT